MECGPAWDRSAATVAKLAIAALVLMLGQDVLRSSAAIYPYGTWGTAVALALAVRCARRWSRDIERFVLCLQAICVAEVWLGSSTHTYSLALAFGLALWQVTHGGTPTWKRWGLHAALCFACLLPSFQTLLSVSPLLLACPLLLAVATRLDRGGFIALLILLVPYPYLGRLFAPNVPILGDGIGAGSAPEFFREGGQIALLFFLLAALSGLLPMALGPSDREKPLRALTVTILAMLGVSSYLEVGPMVTGVDIMLIPLTLATLADTHFGQSRRRAGIPKRSGVRLASAALLILAIAGFAIQKRQASDRIVDEWLAKRPPSEVKLGAISKDLIRATIATEDRDFYRHAGIEPIAMHRALRIDIRAGQVKQGGSTLSQQLAKNLFLSQERTLGRKIDELFLALALERRCGKNEILEAYLNQIPYGMGAVGVQNATRLYFGKEPDVIDLADAIALVSLVPYDPQTPGEIRRALQTREAVARRLVSAYPSSYARGDLWTAASRQGGKSFVREITRKPREKG